MTLRLPKFLCRAAVCAGLGLMMASCSSTKTKAASTGGKIDKVKYYHLADINKPIVAAEPSISFEKEYILHGAVTKKEREARQGHYYAVFWKVTDRSQPVKVRLEYRQQKMGAKVMMIEEEVASPRGSNVTKFAINGEPYVINGPVTSFRVSLVRGKEVLSEEKSYLWE